MKDGTLKDPCAYCCKNNHPNGCDIGLVDIKLGAYLEGGFPKPTWLRGGANGTYNVLNGAVKGSFHTEIDYGPKCTPSGPPDNGPAAQAQDVAAEQKTQLVKSLYPANNTTGFALTDRPRVLYGFAPNQSFDIIESQGGTAGATLNRTFQAKYAITFQKKVGNAFGNPLTVQTTANQLGEYIIYQPTNIINMQQFNNNMMEDGGGGNPPPTYGKNFDSSSTYKVTVTGTLWELKNGTWLPAKTKANLPISDAMTVPYFTVAPPVDPKIQKLKMNNQ
jgi:hypothetical protein